MANSFKLITPHAVLMLNIDKRRNVLEVTDTQSTSVCFKLGASDGKVNDKASDILGVFVGILNEVSMVDECKDLMSYIDWRDEHGTGDDKQDRLYFMLINARWAELQKLECLTSKETRAELYLYSETILNTLASNGL